MNNNLKINTSYYSKFKHFPISSTLVSVSRKSPYWIPGLNKFEKLYPSWNLIKDFKNNLISINEYTDRYYKEVLNKISPELIIKYLKFVSKNNFVILLCWEKPDQFCHRHLIATYIQENTNYIVNELQY